MPPKKKASAPSQKTVQKKKEKIVEDKTFGLKNKKGKKQQEYVKHLSNQVKYGQQGPNKAEQQKFEDKKKKSEAQKERDEMEKLFRPVSQKASAGADPKSLLCAFYKQGNCSKGDKCKFSHDMSLDRKTEKRSVYIDSRDEDDLKDDTMDKWDQEKLEEVVNKKHGSEKAKPRTEIVCKYFLEAIEKGLYGWFWACPNGGNKCMYRHALPPGFVLKKNSKKDEVDETTSLEELIETKRANLGSELTKVTYETFIVWKKNRLEAKRKKEEADTKKKKAELKAGRSIGISGREVFQFQPSLVEEADDDEEEAVFERKAETDETSNVKYIDLTFEELLAAATDDEPTSKKTTSKGASKSKEGNAADDGDDNKLGEAAGYSNVTDDGNAAVAGSSDNATANSGSLLIEEDLFMDDIDEDLENLELND
ncbi:Zinc finger CCCH domain-containing protein 15 [Trichoplax sp. H2]|nr:Zinc finger CCCH domain-containing protein 15 [Trichoplax sp. H2]|eukprot:RDD45125.1 Zinc finger CCCH domain-containing protein 15 [Trichoplax sp. H2]